METSRIALIRYSSPVGTECVGSGLLVDDRHVLTADHVAEGARHRVECAGSETAVNSVLRSHDATVDLAVLTIGNPVRGLAKLGWAQVDRSQVDRVTGCVAVGFPRWKKSGSYRVAAQVHGWVPTAEGLESAADAGLRAGYLTLVGDRIPGAPPIPDSELHDRSGSPWGGMSGAGVAVGNIVLGVVRSHNLATGGQSLTVTPVAALERLPEALRQQFCTALEISDAARLPLLPGSAGSMWRADSVAASSDGEYTRLSAVLKARRALLPAQVSGIAFSPDGGRLIATGGTFVRLWDPATGQQAGSLERTGHVGTLAFSPDARLLATATGHLDDKTAHLSDPATGELIRTLSGHDYGVHDVAFSPDGRMLATNDGTARLWNPATGELIRTLDRTEFVHSLVFSPDGRMLAVVARETSLWNPATGEHIRTLPDHTFQISAVAFSPDGRMLATGTSDKTVRLWDAATGEQIRTLTGHTDWVRSVAFSPQGNLLASGASDKTARLWNPAGHVSTLRGHYLGAYDVAFSPDGHLLATSDDKVIRLWR